MKGHLLLSGLREWALAEWCGRGRKAASEFRGLLFTLAALVHWGHCHMSESNFQVVRNTILLKYTGNSCQVLFNASVRELAE